MSAVDTQPEQTAIPLAQFTSNTDATQDNSSNLPRETAQAWLSEASEVTGAYMHVPFCFHKCHYCDFFSIVGDETQQLAFAERLISEIESVAPYIKKPLSSVFIGGGTPTLLAPALLARVLDSFTENFTLAESYEWTIEANPETVTSEIAQTIRNSGVNRVSIGAQSFNEDCLKALERWHEPASVGRSVELLRRAGIENINLDLIFAIPNQTLEIFRDDLSKTIELNPDHISSYALTYEPNTPLFVREKRGEVKKIDEDIETRMFEETMSILSSHGYEQYEVSSYAKPNCQCKHNLMYWNNESWWPFGPAAAGHLSGRRWRNIPRLSEYVQLGGMPPIEDMELLSPNMQAGETLMLGLRLRAGIPKERVEQLVEVKDGSWRRAVIEGYVSRDLLEWSPNLRLTSQGLLLADTVIGDLLMEESPMVDISN